MVEQIYRLDMVPDGRPLVVHVSQYDKIARRLSFELYNGGVAYEIPSGAVASIAGTKPDGTAFLYSMTISGTTVSIDIEQQMALVAGDVPAEIQITDSNGKIGSANFVIKVERGPIDEDSVISETDIPIFEELVSEAQDAAQESASQAQNAAASATAAEQAAQTISAILPASAGSTGQVLTKTASGADWQDSGVSVKANEATLATVESGSTASRAYSVGNYLVYNGQLYKVISAITAGQTLTPNTNIQATSVGAQLNALNNDLNNLTTIVNAITYPTRSLNSSNDMNTVDCGTYFQSGSSMPTNAPSGANNAYIIVLKARTYDRIQLWISINTREIKYRSTADWSSGSSSNWSAWKTVSAS